MSTNLRSALRAILRDLPAIRRRGDGSPTTATDPATRNPHRRLAAAVAAVLIASILVALAPTSEAATSSVSMVNTSFNPPTVNIAPGDTVRWTNNETDGTQHTVHGGTFQSGTINPGGTFQTTFTTPGTYNYACDIHPFMTGTVNVGVGGVTTTTRATTTTAGGGGTTTTTTGGGGTTTTTRAATTTTGAGGTTTTTLPPGGGTDLGDGTVLAPSTVVGGVREFRLTMAPVQWEVEPGVVKTAWAFNGTVPGPTIRVPEGQPIRIIVTNNLPEHTAVHFHGNSLPNSMDGVPGITQPHIEPGQSFTYEFTPVTLGTHWYHSHMGGSQVGKGLFGAFEVVPASGDPWAANRDYRVLIGDGELGFTFNGKVFPATKQLEARVGEKVHLRLIGTGPELNHPIHLHGMSMQVVAQDGHTLPEPYQADTVLVGVGQTYDVIATPTRPGKWLLHCHIFSHSENANGMHGLVSVLNVT
jgi:FtsP/CotA-like multicopper oxidase with cupredoxin domain